MTSTNGSGVRVLPENKLMFSIVNMMNAKHVKENGSNDEVLEGRVIGLSPEGELVVAVSNILEVLIPLNELSMKHAISAKEAVDSRYIGKHFQFIITGKKEDGRLIGSRRKLQERVIAEVDRRLATGPVKVSGVIRNIYDNMCFIEIGTGITNCVSSKEGFMLPKYARVNQPLDVVITGLSEKNGEVVITIDEDLGSDKIVKLYARDILRYNPETKMMSTLCGIGTSVDVYGVEPDECERCRAQKMATMWVIQGKQNIAVSEDSDSLEYEQVSSERGEIGSDDFNSMRAAIKEEQYIINRFCNNLDNIVHSGVRYVKLGRVYGSKNSVVEALIIETLLRTPGITLGSLYNKIKTRKINKGKVSKIVDVKYKDFLTSIGSMINYGQIKMFRADWANVYANLIIDRGYMKQYVPSDEQGIVVTLSAEYYIAYKEMINDSIPDTVVDKFINSEIRHKTDSAGEEADKKLFRENVESQKKNIQYMINNCPVFQEMYKKKVNCPLSRKLFTLSIKGVQEVAVLEYAASRFEVKGLSRTDKHKRFKYNLYSSFGSLNDDKYLCCIFVELDKPVEGADVSEDKAVSEAAKKEFICFVANFDGKLDTASLKSVIEKKGIHRIVTLSDRKVVVSSFDELNA